MPAALQSEPCVHYFNCPTTPLLVGLLRDSTSAFDNPHRDSQGPPRRRRLGHLCPAALHFSLIAPDGPDGIFCVFLFQQRICASSSIPSIASRPGTARAFPHAGSRLPIGGTTPSGASAIIFSSSPSLALSTTLEPPSLPSHCHSSASCLEPLLAISTVSFRGLESVLSRFPAASCACHGRFVCVASPLGPLAPAAFDEHPDAICG